jgi:hypothetical protein
LNRTLTYPEPVILLTDADWLQPSWTNPNDIGLQKNYLIVWRQKNDNGELCWKLLTVKFEVYFGDQFHC